jgi:three-Cys-motif partner protein
VAGNKGFFERPQPAAVLKHGILRRYLPVFASKTGSQSRLGIVVYVDGYAGEGTYKDGSPGSPALAVEAARAISKTRQLRCFFVEKRKGAYEALRAYLDAHGKGLDCRPLRGRIEDHLEQILYLHPDEPVFVFLDPFGVGVHFDHAKALLQRSPNGHPKTEVLLNFNVQSVDRIGGLIDSCARHRVATLDTLDGSMGGDWWQEIYRSTTGFDRVEKIASGYRQRLTAAGGGRWGGWTVPVFDRIGGRPEYLLLHFTQHPDGRWEFHQALSGATREWREACHLMHPDKKRQLERLGQQPLEGLEEPQPFEEDEQAWVEELVRNVQVLLAVGEPVRVLDRMREVFGQALGLARETHLRKALRQLWKAERLRNEPKGPLQGYVIAPRGTTPGLQS